VPCHAVLLGCAFDIQARHIIDKHLLETGTILLQGLPISSPEACEAFVYGMAFTRQEYEPYGGVRAKVGERKTKW
jgi:hypothetical protein